MDNKDASKNFPKIMRDTLFPRTKLRGWFHAGYTPLVLACGIVLLCLAPGAVKKLSAVAFLITSTTLFAISAVYHIFNWSPKVKAIFRRLDHSNIFLIIAGTYTPIAVSCLPWNPYGRILLISIWAATILGLIFHIIWINAPRPLYVVLYIFLGLFSVAFLPEIAKHGGNYSIAIVALIASGGLFYIVGAIFYAAKWPLRYAKVFGFHELFHCFTLVAFACHCVAIYFAVLTC